MSARAPRPSWTTLPAGSTGTVVEALAARFPHVPAAVWRRRGEEGLVIDGEGRPLPPHAPAAAGLRIGYFREVPDEPVPIGEISLLQVDDRLVVADKPPFVPVTPAGAHVRRCLLYRVEEALGDRRLTPVHRLDRATSGLVLFARDREAAAAYGGLFARGEIDRRYEALARVPEPPATSRWQVESRIVPGEPFFRMAETSGPPNAATDVELAEVRRAVGRFRLRPASGKKHQLRLHMARLGWPILGDRLYPELRPEAPDDPRDPLRLVAVELRFEDPFTGERRRFRSGRAVDEPPPWT